jgi:DNA-binding transcriptional MerR regulator
VKAPLSEYRIDELARAACTTVRNVRAYQDRGILPPPRREGRVAWYSEAHLARLRVVGALLERGYSIANIAELIATWERGGDLRDLLGLDVAITSPFTDEAPTAVGLEELAEMFGTADPVVATKAMALGLLELQGLRAVVPSLRLLRASAELRQAGIPLDDLLDAIARLRHDTDRIASRLVDLIVAHLVDPPGDARSPAKEASRLAERIRRVRSLAEIVVVTQLASALERHARARLGERFARLFERPRRRAHAPAR